MQESESRRLLELHLQSGLLSPAFFQDPYSFYSQMRDIDPVMWINKLNAWLVTDYSLITEGLKDDGFSVNRKDNFFNSLSYEELIELSPLKDFFSLWLMFVDPPYHEKLKSILYKSFSPKSLKRYEYNMEASAERVLTENSLTNVDFLHDVAQPFGILSLSEVLGLESTEYEKIIHWSELLLGFLSGESADIGKGRKALQAFNELKTYILEVINKKRENTSDDIISNLIEKLDEGEITESELIAILANLIVDGHDPIANTLSNGFYELLQNKRELEKLSDDNSLLPSAVEEILRINPYFQYSARRALTSIQLGNHTIQPEDRVMFMIGAANRDPKSFDNPETFDVSRTDNKHLSFGKGIHYCLGAAFARQACEVALKVVLSKKTNIHLQRQDIEWNNSIGYRGLKHLAVSWRDR